MQAYGCNFIRKMSGCQILDMQCVFCFSVWLVNHLLISIFKSGRLHIMGNCLPSLSRQEIIQRGVSNLTKPNKTTQDAKLENQCESVVTQTELAMFMIVANELHLNKLEELRQEFYRYVPANEIPNILHCYYTAQVNNNDANVSFSHFNDFLRNRLSNTVACEKFDRIDKLPKDVLTCVSSYLQLRDYVLFSHTNRQIFVSIMQSIQIEVLEVKKMPTNLQRFGRVRELHINTNILVKYFEKHPFQVCPTIVN